MSQCPSYCENVLESFDIGADGFISKITVKLLDNLDFYLFRFLAGEELNAVFPVLLVDDPHYLGIGIQGREIVVGIVQLNLYFVSDIKADAGLYYYGHPGGTDVETLPGQFFIPEKYSALHRQIYTNVCAAFSGIVHV